MERSHKKLEESRYLITTAINMPKVLTCLKFSIRCNTNGEFWLDALFV
jgi:hypothetical protein